MCDCLRSDAGYVPHLGWPFAARKVFFIMSLLPVVMVTNETGGADPAR